MSSSLRLFAFALLAVALTERICESVQPAVEETSCPRGRDLSKMRSAGRWTDEAPAVFGTDDDKAMRVVIAEDTTIMLMGSGRKIVTMLSENPNIATVSAAGHPCAVRIVGLKPGRVHIVLADEEGRVEVREVRVIDTEDEMFEAKLRLPEKRREILRQLIRQLAPSAKVEVGLEVRRIKQSRDGTLANCTVTVSGTAVAEEIHTIADLTNACFPQGAFEIFAVTGVPSPPRADWKPQWTMTVIINLRPSSEPTVSQPDAKQADPSDDDENEELGAER